MASTALAIALEVGTKRVFAVALEWPGWARSGRDEQGAIDALLGAGHRYVEALRAQGVRPSPRRSTSCEVVERLPGGAGTDFGVPEASLTIDGEPVDQTQVRRLSRIVSATWVAFDRAEEAASGATLAKGPRGGGRSLEKIGAHVQEADRAYLRSLGGAAFEDATASEVRSAFLDALGARARGDLPATGPRGGKRWTARYAARRAAWHALDHAWEIEDRRWTHGSTS